MGPSLPSSCKLLSSQQVLPTFHLPPSPCRLSPRSCWPSQGDFLPSLDLLPSHPTCSLAPPHMGRG